MIKRTLQSLLFVCLFAGTLWAAKDPFVGNWKMDKSKSHFTGLQVRIKALGGNKYIINTGDTSDTIVANGKDQPVHFGNTESLTGVGPKVWKFVVKRNGRELGHSTWTLSQDDKTINVQGVAQAADGSTSRNHIIFKRMAGTTGFAGEWDTAKVDFGAPQELDIRPYDSNGLSIISPHQRETDSMKFDGKDYPDRGPNVAPGATSSGRRVDERTLEITDKVKGKVTDTTQFKLSPELNTLTLTVHLVGEHNPFTIVFDRQ